MTRNSSREALVAGLRALADDLEAYDGPLPTHPPKAEWLIFGDKLEQQKAEARATVRGMGGQWDKGRRHKTTFFDFTKDYGGGVEATVVVDRPAVCERVVVGTETVTLPEQPAQEAKPARTEEREIVEWRCEPLMAEAEVS